MPRARTALSVFILGLLPFRFALAQGEDARPLGRGAWRVMLGPDWARWDHRFGRGTPGQSDGSSEPLDVDFSSDALGTTQLPVFVPTEASLRSVTGLSGFALNLGRARLTLNASVRVMPLSIELGVSRRLSVGVTLPLYRSRVEAFLLGPDTGAAAAATRGNVGFNPAFLTPGVQDDFRDEVDSVLIALRTQAASGPVALRAQAQAQLDAWQSFLCGLYTLAGGSATSSTSVCFQTTAVASSPILPVSGSAAGDSIELRLARAQQQYDALRGQYAGQGVTLPTFTSFYDLPGDPLDTTAMHDLFESPAGPFAAESLASVVRTRLGDVEVGVRYQLVERPAWRSQVGLVVRLPTGSTDSPNNWIDIGAGDRQLDVEVAWRNDLVLTPELWVHGGLRLGVQTAAELERRVAPSTMLLVPAANLARVRRNLGDYLLFDLVPNWQLDDAFSVGLGVHYFSQGTTTFTYADPADEARIGLAASVLNEETAMRWLRTGAGITFSTLARHAAGRARVPYTVTAAYYRTLSGGGGRTPDADGFVLLMRAYLRTRR